MSSTLQPLGAFSLSRDSSLIWLPRGSLGALGQPNLHTGQESLFSTLSHLASQTSVL